MNATLEDRLRSHYDARTRDLPEHGPGLDDSGVITLASWSDTSRSNRTARLAMMIGSVAAAVVIGLVLVNRPANDPAIGSSETSLPAGSTPGTVDAVVAVETVPESVGIAATSVPALPPAVDLIEAPITIPAGSALSYWRWLPDLDISERQTSEGGTELCWRTPAGTGCIDDSFISPSVGVIPTEGGAIFLARPALIKITPPPADPNAPKFALGPNPTTVTVTLSDGSTVTAEINYGDQFGVGYARLQLPTDVTVSSAASS
jgi:hypothetical protein